MRIVVLALVVILVLTQNVVQYTSTPLQVAYSTTTSSSSSSQGGMTTVSGGSNAVPPVTILLTPGALNQIILAPSLLGADGGLTPLTGFRYNYSISGLPNWASYSAGNNSLVLRPPNNFNSQVNLTVVYSDIRNNRQTVNINLAPSSNINERSYDFIARDPRFSLRNYQTIGFPTFSGAVGGNMNAIRLTSTQAYIINSGVAPWTANIQIVRPGFAETEAYLTRTTTTSTTTSGSSGNTGGSSTTIIGGSQSNPNVAVGLGGSNVYR